MSRTYEQLEPVISALDERIKTGLGAFPTDTAEGSIASFPDGADDIPLKSLVVNIDPVQSGSGDPSPDNVRPISGWTGANVTRCGKNLFDKTDTSKQMPNAYIGSNKLVEGNDRCVCFISCKPNTLYAVSREAVLTGERFAIGYIEEYPSVGVDVYEVKTATTSQTIGDMMSLTLTTGANAKYLVVWAYWGGASEALDTLQIELGDSATEYESFKGTSIPINWQTEAGTVYGGKLDVLSGELTVDRAMQELDGSGTITMGHAGSGDVAFRYFQWGNDYAVDTNVWETDVIANFLVTITGGRGARVQYNVAKCPRIIVPESGSLFETVEDLKAYLNETHLTIVYPLATPITIQLTPQQVNSLLGVNNIWADSGDTEVEYRADTKLFIERLTAPDSADMIADANIVSGQYFLLGNSLYLATSNIASGGQVIVGTNCTRKSLSEALNEINQ